MQKLKILAWSKLKAFADDVSDVPTMLIYVSDRVGNMDEKQEIAGYQHFLLFPYILIFSSCFFLLVVKFRMVWYMYRDFMLVFMDYEDL